MKSVFLLLIVCSVAVNCLPADPDDVVPESVLSSEVVGVVTSKSGCFPPKLMSQTMRNRGNEQMFLCDGIQYYVTVPKRCGTSKKCGLIMDIHGWGMDAQLEEASDHITKWGKEYITIRPQEGVDKDWSTSKSTGHAAQWDDLHRLEGFLRAAIKRFGLILDNTRVHVAGFSQGGFLTYNLLCRASDVICSIAPIGVPASGKFVGGGAAKEYYNSGYLMDPNARGHKNCFVDGSGPNHMRSIMYNQGKYDCFFAESTAKDTMHTIKKLYGMKGRGKALRKGKGVDWRRYRKGRINFEAAVYDYQTELVSKGMKIQGHCFPSTFKKGAPTSPLSCGRKDGYTWGDEALKFFKANPCQHDRNEKPKHNDGKKLDNGCPADMPHRYPHNNRCFQRVWGGKACNVDPKNDPHKHQRRDKPCRFAPRVCNPKHNDGKKLRNGCPSKFPHRYPHNQRCFKRKWRGGMCNVNPKADHVWHQKADRKCCYA